MKSRTILNLIVAVVGGIVVALSLVLNIGLMSASPVLPESTEAQSATRVVVATDRTGDEELAYMLVKLMLETRREIAGHFTRVQSPIPVVSRVYQRLMVKNLILPAAVADHVFAETVPSATNGRAWVKMIVDEPRNPHNQGDQITTELLAELRTGKTTAERTTDDAFYYAEPIKAKRACLYCHGLPKGAPDPYFPQYTKDGWSEGDVIGAVMARVAPD